MESLPESEAHSVHLTIEETLLIACGVVDATGRPNPGRTGLAAKDSYARIAEKIATCEHCRQIAIGACRNLRSGTPVVARRGPARRRWPILSAAALLLFVPVIVFGLSQTGNLYAFEGWRPISVGEQVKTLNSMRQVTLYSGFQKTGEILIHPASSVTVLTIQRDQLELELLDGNVNVSLSALDSDDVVRLHVGDVVTESAVGTDQQVHDLALRFETLPEQSESPAPADAPGPESTKSEAGVVAIHVDEGAVICQSEELQPTLVTEGESAIVRVDANSETSIEVTGQTQELQ